MPPLANMFGYRGALRSLAGETASFAMEFPRYAETDPGGGPDDFPAAAAMRA